ncbi:MAG: hypothetical protein A2143_10855 [Gallionellales bacterium RBG_16_57_15]|nr:MAG: hypothetical protein A2143_10855 [Gallionellales bacterium RBG_16_57_15]
MSKPEINRPGPQEYLDLFETDRRGARILEDMILRFTQPAVVTGGIDAVLKTYQRIGQREVIDFIVRQINRANGVQESQPEESNDV